MENQDRRRRRRELTRDRILQAALDLAREEGWSNVTVRRVADRVDYTHPALYAYFATKEDLLYALLRQGLELFRAALEAARAVAPSPGEGVFAIAAAHWDFAWQHPELYQLMHGMAGVAFDSADAVAEGQRSGEPAVATVGALLAEHGLDPADAERKVVLLWSTIHGLVVLTMAGRFSREEATALATQAVRDALVAWGVRQPAVAAAYRGAAR